MSLDQAAHTCTCDFRAGGPFLLAALGGTELDGAVENLSQVLLCLVSTLLSAPDVVPLVQRNTEPSPCRSLFFPLVPFLFFKKNIMCINKMLKEMKVKWQEGFFFFFWLLGFMFFWCVFFTSPAFPHLSGVAR